MSKVFISHTDRDTEWARSFAQALAARGLTVWFDESGLRPGENFVEALEAALRGSDTLISLFDLEGSSMPNFFFELGAAIGMGKNVVPIVPKGVDPAKLPLDLRRRRYLVRGTPEETAEALSNTLRAA